MIYVRKQLTRPGIKYLKVGDQDNISERPKKVISKAP